MQIAFFDCDNDELTSYRKGRLFERFTERLVDLCGYEQVVLRAKRASLEYDIEAVAKMTLRQLDGEAKAHESSISGKEVSAFVGKLIPLAVTRGGVDGLFISTSPFTPDGADYLRSLTPEILTATKMTIRTLVGQEIIDFLFKNGACASESAIRAKVRLDTRLEPLDSWYVIGEHGDVIVASCGPSAASAPTNFLAYSTAGERTDLSESDVARLRLQVSDLQNLVYFRVGESTGETVERASLPSVLAGAGWFDYKFPSPPECFIGRTDPLDEIVGYLNRVREEGITARTIQVLSRSGVGKSSLLLKVAASKGAIASVTVDGRNLLTPSDLRLVVSSLVKSLNDACESSLNPPVRQEDISGKLGEVGSLIKGRNEVATIQIDQFEALLSRPSVFQGVLDLVVETTERTLPIVWIMARKNDLAATYDEGAAIDLARLNELSYSIELDDFSVDEEKALLSRLSTELETKLSPQLTEAILTFSAGFPWLLKRVCAHILGMAKSGTDVSQLARGGLRAEDLFDEDLAGLDEADKALLRVFAANLPNTAAELSRRLEGEVSFQRLTDKLNDFLGRKLLRLAGDVYDTYNDVFKSYLLTNRIPFQARYVFRVTPGAALGLLTTISDEGPLDAATFAKRIGGNPTAVYNKLRELRLLGFIDPQPGRVALSAEATAAIDSEQIGDFLRKALRANALVSRVLDLVASEEKVDLGAVTTLLQRELPHIRVNSTTWAQYSSILVNWLRYAGIIDVEGDLIRQRESASDEMLLRREFNLGNFTPGTFVPSTRPPKVRELVEFLRNGTMNRSEVRSNFGSKYAAAVVRDARALSLVEDDGDVVRLTAQGRALVANGAEITDRDIAVLCLSKQNVAALIDAASAGALSKNDQREVLSRFGSANWSEQTWGWRVGIITSWVVATGQAKGGRIGLRSATSVRERGQS
ncbi:restriction endonuclease [Lentzea fradiae]|nr:restriction endonuclease [Lentzea fradiae]